MEAISPRKKQRDLSGRGEASLDAQKRLTNKSGFNSFLRGNRE